MTHGDERSRQIRRSLFDPECLLDARAPAPRKQPFWSQAARAQEQCHGVVPSAAVRRATRGNGHERRGRSRVEGRRDRGGEGRAEGGCGIRSALFLELQDDASHNPLVAKRRVHAHADWPLPCRDVGDERATARAAQRPVGRLTSRAIDGREERPRVSKGVSNSVSNSGCEHPPTIARDARERRRRAKTVENAIASSR